jgi:NADPH:quinone reductase-like Zn-dependent oxidoreductase
VAGVRLASLGASQKVVFFVAKFSREDFLVLQELLEAGKVTPVIDREYELAEVPAALNYLGEGHARAKVVLTV